MKALTVESITPALGKWLDKTDIKAVIERRDKMQKMIDDLVKKYGADNVFIK
jgi:N-methylhydantoinase B/oxoprolinase/acetone carboxylase alpha subunit